MVLNPILLGGVWFIIHRYSVFHTFIWMGWVGGLSQMKLTSFEKNCHILRRSLREKLAIKENKNRIIHGFPNLICKYKNLLLLSNLDYTLTFNDNLMTKKPCLLLESFIFWKC
jgi:hypothetical protein